MEKQHIYLAFFTIVFQYMLVAYLPLQGVWNILAKVELVTIGDRAWSQ